MSIIFEISIFRSLGSKLNGKIESPRISAQKRLILILMGAPGVIKFLLGGPIGSQGSHGKKNEINWGAIQRCKLFLILLLIFIIFNILIFLIFSDGKTIFEIFPHKGVQGGASFVEVSHAVLARHFPLKQASLRDAP